MAYFECISSGAGGGATITVTYDSSFYNKTMTCSNGTKTYTKTTTSSGSTEFSVSDEGTWTITCNGVSRTVNVVLNYSVAMMITKTVTVYGAAGATISFTDAVGSKTVTLNNSGQGSASITFIPPSQTITFTDTNKAKNPNNLSQNYSKSITITESTTSIKVMPDKALYWFGNKCEWFTGGVETSLTTWGTYNNFISPTYNTNSFTTPAYSGTNYSSGYAYHNDIKVKAGDKVHVILDSVSGSTNSTPGAEQNFSIIVFSAKSFGGGASWVSSLYVPDTSVRVHKVLDVTGTGYICVARLWYPIITCSAIWIE